MKTLNRNHADVVSDLISDLAIEEGFTVEEAEQFAHSFWLMLTGHELEK